MYYEIDFKITTASVEEIQQFATDHGCTVEADPAKVDNFIFRSDNFHYLHELASGFLDQDATDFISQIN